MIEFPNLSIVLLTYKRTKEATRTLESLCAYLGYEQRLRSFYIADDGTPGKHVEKLLTLLQDKGERILGWHNQRFSPQTGIGWNKGLGIAFQNSDYVMVLEDDWVLRKEFDIHPYIEMLSQCDGQTEYKGTVSPNVGMVRLGGLAVGNDVRIVGWNGHHYLWYYKNEQYAYSGNPHIRHARMVRAYGWYSEEKLNPGELELDYDGRVRAMEGPEIWRPADIPGWGVFDHIGESRYR